MNIFTVVFVRYFNFDISYTIRLYFSLFLPNTKVSAHNPSSSASLLPSTEWFLRMKWYWLWHSPQWNFFMVSAGWPESHSLLVLATLWRNDRMKIYSLYVIVCTWRQRTIPYCPCLLFLILLWGFSCAFLQPAKRLSSPIWLVRWILKTEWSWDVRDLES